MRVRCGFDPPNMADAYSLPFREGWGSASYFSSSTAACAAARRAIGTRNGEQEA